MLGHNPNIGYQVKQYCSEKVQMRKAHVQDRINRLVKVVTDIMKQVEQHEPRFIPTLVQSETTGRYEGLLVHSPSEYEVILYLNQMGVFNFVDDGSIQGCAVLKLSDGRKRSMSLWVEFITASGYLSARKIRGRFHTLVAQTLEKPAFRTYCRMQPDTSDVRIRIDDQFTVQITCAFRCHGIWPRSAAHWPGAASWPMQQAALQVKQEGFDLCSRDTTLQIVVPKGQQQNASSMEGDAFAMCMFTSESLLLVGQRRRCLSMLRCLRDTHLDVPGTPVTNYIVKTLLLGECEKHPHEFEWEDENLGDRIIGVFLQLVSCLQCRRCPHYFLPQLDLLRGRPPQLLDQAARQVWALLRRLMLNAHALETL
ncbi:hypothetical protein PMAYCL1PPCAC_13472 [Pristionchus mayeri]|uniref:Mab-21 n=1 Tax=Pristionchus mayeri TaxID=1317129 RepID=A0AAN5CGE0_9BILA|nr:hypothetical protein PMAYCL1PPCAC_13472 [Pristionchus mayeri]